MLSRWYVTCDIALQRRLYLSANWPVENVEQRAEEEEEGEMFPRSAKSSMKALGPIGRATGNGEFNPENRLGRVNQADGRRRRMQKRTTSKKRTTKSVKLRRKKAAPAATGKRLTRPTQATNVLTAVRNALDKTAAKLKSLLPNDSRSKRREDVNEMA